VTIVSLAVLVLMNAPLEQSLRAISIQLTPTCAPSVALVQMYVRLRLSACPKGKYLFENTKALPKRGGLFRIYWSLPLHLKMAVLPVHPLLALRVTHFLNGIAEGSAWHVVGMLTEKVAQQLHRHPLAQLA